MRCRNGQEHTHETAAQSKACWLGGHADTTATLAQPVATDRGMSGADHEATLARAATAALASPSVQVAAPSVQVANGRYALYGADGAVHFYRVTAGHKPGVIFVDEQAGDDLWPVKGRARRMAILTTIADDPDALARYGRELGVCGKCGRALTDEASRAAGIGPVCAGRE